MPDVAPLRTGDPAQVAGHRLAGRIGSGGQGVVYLGISAAGEHVAVKLLRVEDERSREQFVKEVAAARRVAPFCTAQILDFDLESQPPYVISEFIEGLSLQQYVEAHGPLTGTRLQRLAIGTATALAAIHQAGVVHRDMKPANVMMSPEGPRVIDFGIARDLSNDTTKVSKLFGTPAYMSPEQLRGERVGPSTDLFAWGSVMTFAATGRAPFEAPHMMAAINKIAHEEPDLSGVPLELLAVLRQCFNKDPAYRPSAQQALSMLLGRPEEAGTPNSAVVLAEATQLVESSTTGPTESYATGETPLDPNAHPTAVHHPATVAPTRVERPQVTSVEEGPTVRNPNPGGLRPPRPTGTTGPVSPGIPSGGIPAWGTPVPPPANQPRPTPASRPPSPNQSPPQNPVQTPTAFQQPGQYSPPGNRPPANPPQSGPQPVGWASPQVGPGQPRSAAQGQPSHGQPGQGQPGQGQPGQGQAAQSRPGRPGRPGQVQSPSPAQSQPEIPIWGQPSTRSRPPRRLASPQPQAPGNSNPQGQSGQGLQGQNPAMRSPQVQNPVSPNPQGQSQHPQGQNSPGQNSPGQSGPGQSGPGQNGPGQNGPGQNGPGQNAWGQNAYGQNQQGHPTHGQNQQGRSPQSQSAQGQNPPTQNLQHRLPVSPWGPTTNNAQPNNAQPNNTSPSPQQGWGWGQPAAPSAPAPNQQSGGSGPVAPPNAPAWNQPWGNSNAPTQSQHRAKNRRRLILGCVAAVLTLVVGAGIWGAVADWASGNGSSTGNSKDGSTVKGAADPESCGGRLNVGADQGNDETCSKGSTSNSGSGNSSGTTGKVAPAGTLPYALEGVWEGEISQPAGAVSEWTVQLDLKGGKKRPGSMQIEELGCSSTVTVKSAAPTAATLRVPVLNKNNPEGACAKLGEVTLSPDPSDPDTLSFTWRDLTSVGNVATGAVERVD